MTMLTSLMSIYMAICMIIMPYCDTRETWMTWDEDHVYVIEEVTDYQGRMKSHEKYCFTYEEYKEWRESH